MITFRLDASEVTSSIRELERRGRDLAPAMRVIRTEMRGDQRAHARAQEGPDGKWARRAPSTIRASRKGSGRPRRLMGRLPTAAAYRVQSRQVVGESLVPWSGVHMTGGTVGRGSKLPARPFLWISDKLLATSILVLRRYLFEGWGR